MFDIIAREEPVRHELLIEGGLILVDKPAGWTSFDVVNKLRFSIKSKLGIKKYKVGHAGTLDPLATGLMLICISRHTKKIDALMGLNKTYSGTFRMGEETPTYDAESQPVVYYPSKIIEAEILEEARQRLTGIYLQIPPIYSAIKQKGVPLYKRARRGETIAVQPRQVEIHSFEITEVDWPFINFTVDCSKGTYIRSLAFDFGKAVGSGAYLSALRRTRIGDYALEDAWSLPDLLKAIDEAGRF